MKALLLTWFLGFSLVASASEGKRLRVAYPAEGTILSAQVGLVFEKTEILKKHGFTGSAVAMGTGRELKTALVSGQADVILTSETNFVILVGNGYDCYAVSSLGSAGRMALVVPPDSKIRSLEDLKGQRVATIFGTSIHQPAQEWLEQAGLAADVEIVDLSSQAAMTAALKTGAVAAMMTWDPFLAQGLNRGHYRIVKERAFDLITVASKTFHSSADDVRRFNEATREALLYVSQHKTEVNGWFSAMTKLDVKTIDDASRLNANYSVRALGDVDLSISARFREQMNREARFLFAQKSLTRLPELGKYIE